MFSSRKARLLVFIGAATTLGSGLFVYMTPASTNVNPAPFGNLPGIAGNATTYRSWGADLSENAVDANGIELDLDGNASALVSSPCDGLPGCGNPL